ncbi:ATP-binding protein [Streptomyces sp. NPDC054855]
MTMAPARSTDQPGFNTTLVNAPQTAGEARRLVRVAFSAWDVEEHADIAQVVISELVTNAVRHTGSRCIRVIVEHPAPDRVLVAVVDTSRDLPRMGAPSAEGLSGRGLLLVDALSQHWGSTRLGPDGRRGKKVWAQLEIKPRVGDEVEYAPHCRAVLADIHKGWPILRGPGGVEWAAADPEGLRVTRTRAERNTDAES